MGCWPNGSLSEYGQINGVLDQKEILTEGPFDLKIPSFFELLKVNFQGDQFSPDVIWVPKREKKKS